MCDHKEISSQILCEKWDPQGDKYQGTELVNRNVSLCTGALANTFPE